MNQRRRFQFDDFGQVDGDSAGAVDFRAAGGGQPWLRGSTPPWHMWGNSQTIVGTIETTGAPRQGVTNTLVRINYKRPETWHWLFKATLLDGPDNTATFFSRIFVHWQLNVGIGRSFQKLAFRSDLPFAVQGFDDYSFLWTDPDPFPRGATIWTTQTTSPARNFDAAGPFPAGDPVTEITAQDLQLEVQLVGLTVAGNVAAVGQNYSVEVSAQFSPKTHVRPDWFVDGPAEVAFPGEEIGGR